MDIANCIAAFLTIKPFRGLVICSARRRLDWAEDIRKRSTIPNTWLCVVTSSASGVPAANSEKYGDFGQHWTIISYNLARVPRLAHLLSANSYDLCILDQVPSFDVRAVLGRVSRVVTIDRAARTRIFAMEGKNAFV